MLLLLIVQNADDPDLSNGLCWFELHTVEHITFMLGNSTQLLSSHLRNTYCISLSKAFLVQALDPRHAYNVDIQGYNAFSFVRGSSGSRGFLGTI